MPQPVVHFEVTARDAAAQREFFTNVFEWDMNYFEPANYTLIDTGGGDVGINGGLMQSEEGKSFVTIYIQVDDLQEYLYKAESHGAKTIMPPQEIPGGENGSIALFSDP